MTLRTLTFAVFAVAFAICGTAMAEDIAYVVTSTHPHPNSPPIAAGTVHYSARDINSKHQRSDDGSDFWDKSVLLGGNFTLGVHITREKQITGVGLVVGNRRAVIPFSWNWFDLVDGNTFKQLKGDGRLRVEVRDVDSLKEIASVEFLDDTTLTFTDNMFAHPGADGDTHLLLVKKGSVLRLVP